ncbi:MAG: hypothetical protein ACRDLK_03180, partial [Gaiellaceae bacterium]
MARDEGRERLWLARAERAAGASEFAGRAALRLALGDLAYGHRWAELGLDRLITEVAEEAADLGAWGVLALQALERDPSRDLAGDGPIGRRLHGAI